MFEIQSTKTWLAPEGENGLNIRDLTGKHVFDGSDASGVIGVPTDSMDRSIYTPLTLLTVTVLCVYSLFYSCHIDIRYVE